MSIWLSVDPLADVDPDMTPFHFFNNNPISIIDPDGRTGYTVDEQGNFVQVSNTGSDRYDVIWMAQSYADGERSYDYKGTGNTGIRINDKSFVTDIQKNRTDEGIVQPVYGSSTGETTRAYYADINSNQADNVFEFLADATGGNSGKEWSLLKQNDGTTTIGILEEGGSQAINWGRIDKFKDRSTWTEDIHSHNGDTWDSFNPSGNDIAIARNNPNTIFKIYMPMYNMANYNRVAEGKVRNYNGTLVPAELLTNEPESKYKTIY